MFTVCSKYCLNTGMVLISVLSARCAGDLVRTCNVVLKYPDVIGGVASDCGIQPTNRTQCHVIINHYAEIWMRVRKNIIKIVHVVLVES